ncbi:ammonium transporter [Dongia mobilis]|uniref:Ammonium transporter n=1 Tax=Dongia mobilis TaxID=578943 RepID=A0A4R6WW95_9PROT|nr:ammonium transporter [Dongia mobilis]TDQ83947.1 ammonium transporter [Dongia mobilis]
MRTTGGSAENGRDFKISGLSSLSGFIGYAGAGRAGLSSLLRGLFSLLAMAFVMVPGLALAQDEVPTLDKADNVWMMLATALVLFMTVPGLALFYGGLVRKTFTLTVVMQSVACACFITVVWFVVGYSIAFGEGTAYFGDFSKVFLSGLEVGTLSGAIPESIFMLFQMTFAIITPALITGAFADRVKFSTVLVFVILWSILVYSPLCHMVWAGTGWMFNAGILDFAGGTVVHIASGVSGLVIALMIGKRRGYGKVAMPPHNLIFSVIGVGFLWVGWFGFNAGSALAASANAAMAMVVTQIAAAAAGVSWTLVEWIVHKKPSILGIISGIVAGLVGITPAAGFVTPGAALIIGLAAGVVCFFASTTIKKALGYDDALDVFGIHGVGGALGAILTGIFATNLITGAEGPVGVLDGNGGQLMLQLMGVGFTIVFVGIGTAILFKVASLVTGGARVSEEAERDGTDLALHGEAVQ